jgi:hypothetical protein
MAAAARAAERPRRLGSDANDLDTAGLLEHPLSADAAASPPDRLLGSEPSEDNEEEEPRAGRADAGQAPTRAAGPDAGPDADASLMGERGLEDSSLLDVLLGGAVVRAGELATRPPIDAIAAGRVAAQQRLGRLQLVLRARAARGGGEQRQGAA